MAERSRFIMSDPTFFVWGINHKTSPIEAREKLYFDADRTRHLLRAIHEQRNTIAECVLLSTCNRTEAYAVAEDTAAAQGRLSETVAQGQPDLRAYLDREAFRLTGPDAAAHLFSVTSSLDSLLPGETQITGQVRDAYRTAIEERTVGYLLHRTFQKAFHVAKRVRTETRIGESVVSLSHAAIELARKIYGDSAHSHVLLIGTGEMGMLAARRLRALSVQKLVIVSRSTERAAAVAAEVGGEPGRLDELDSLLRSCDLVLASAAVPEPMLHRDLVAGALSHRRGRPLVIIDLGVPRNVHPEVHTLDNVYLYNIDDLRHVAEENRAARDREADKGRALVRTAVEDFAPMLSAPDLDAIVVTFRRKLESITDEELTKALARMNGMPPDQRDQVREFARGLLQKLLHEPTVRLKQEMRQSGNESPGDDPPHTSAQRWLRDALIELFNLKS